jgi:hypothetical protein
MSDTEALWTFVPLVGAIVALLLYARRRKRTADYAKGRAFKAALPSWVSSLELLVALGWASLFAIGAWKACVLFAGPPSPGPITSPGPVFVIVGIGVIILPLALLCANVVSWIVPPLRDANLRAFRGNGVSFRSLNQGLIKGALVSAVAGLILIGIAVIRPWSG